jgi:hypothetical protein
MPGQGTPSRMNRGGGLVGSDEASAAMHAIAFVPPARNFAGFLRAWNRIASVRLQNVSCDE